jgi:hypothetical protein
VPKTITVTIPHRGTPAEVRAQLEKALADFQASPMSKVASLSETWQGDNVDVAAKAMGQTVTGRIEIMADHVVVHVNLPWAFAMFAGKVHGEIEQRGRKLLEKK